MALFVKVKTRFTLFLKVYDALTVLRRQCARGVLTWRGFGAGSAAAALVVLAARPKRTEGPGLSGAFSFALSPGPAALGNSLRRRGFFFCPRRFAIRPAACRPPPPLLPSPPPTLFHLP